MADISTQIAAIQNAVYGEQVRSAISTALTAMNDNAVDAEAWANGTRNGTAIGSSDPAYQKDAKYWSQLASAALPLDSTLSVSGKAADAAAVGDAVLVHYTGTLPESAMGLPDNVWITALGQNMQGLLGSGFTWTLTTGTSYILRKIAVNTSTRYELMTLGGAVKWTGYTLSNSTAITWYYFVDSTLSASGYAADAKIVGDALRFSRSDITLDSMAKYTGSTSGMTDARDLPDNTWIMLYGEDAQFLGSGFPDTLVSGTTYILKKIAVSTGTKRYELSSSGSAVKWTGYSLTSSQNIVWYSYDYKLTNPDSKKPVYVALGTSITYGEIHKSGQSTTRTSYPYPEYFGALHGCETHNLAQGGTGLVSRYNGNKQNFMDVLNDSDNASLLASADLITIEWGGNDSTILSGRVGEYDDYFDYDAALLESDPYAYMQANATEMGALNYCIKKAQTIAPHAILVLINGSGWFAPDTGGSITVSNGKIVITEPSSSSWKGKCKTEGDKLYAALRLPHINCQDYFLTPYNGAANDTTGNIGHDGVHYTNAGYLMRARWFAGQIGQYFDH